MAMKPQLRIQWLLKLSKIPELTEVPSFSKEAEAYLQAIIDGFNVEAALEVKKIEKVTNHDVKAVEYFLKQKCESHPEFAKVLEGGFLDVTVERQAARIRSMYLKTILRQDIGFFNVETNTGEVVGRMSGDTVLLQDAPWVGKFIQLVSTFVGGFALAFVKGWLRSSSRIIYYVQKVRILDHLSVSDSYTLIIFQS
uniref:ABC transmembrane type-1 domain-containing protein n=1 Tax=Brassica campestris TaxID=3711 RepID=M4FIC3_BRACM